MKRIEKLTAEHLAIYLPYGLEMIHHYQKAKHKGETKLRLWIMELTPISLMTTISNQDRNLILRTRQSITPEELETFSICFRMWYDKPDFDYNLMVYSDILQMAKLHIDIFGLIESGLATNKETLK